MTSSSVSVRYDATCAIDLQDAFLLQKIVLDQNVEQRDEILNGCTVNDFDSRCLESAHSL